VFSCSAMNMAFFKEGTAKTALEFQRAEEEVKTTL
jgi:hypothetical protein